MLFAKRRGLWWQFPHGAIIERMRLRGALVAAVVESVYETCLDASFARTGAGIGIVKASDEATLLSDGLIDEADKLTSSSTKGRFLFSMTKGLKFQELDRRLRQDLVAIDGSTILRADGAIIAVGAIIKVAAGSTGGGRLAAAKTLGRYGLGLKVSSDGAILGYRAAIAPKPIELLKFG